MARATGRRWRRSLQLRVVVTTLLLGLVVLALVGSFVLSTVSRGLLESRYASARADALGFGALAAGQVANADVQNLAESEDFLRDLVGQLESQGGERVRDVLLLRAPEEAQVEAGAGADLPAGADFYSDSYTRATIDETITEDLREEVRGSDQLRWQSTTVETPGAEEGRTPALAFGSTLRVPLAGLYELYFVFPLEREVESLEIVRRTLVIGGLVLVALLGGVALVVTRQVVAPVREAARTAEELTSGRLEQRMQVRGEDDLARLGRSFNAMATSLQRQIRQLEELSLLQRRFVSDVSHELRTPLTTIRMAGEVLYDARGGFDPALARTSELLTTQLDRFEALLSDLLEISRFDAGAAVLEAEPTDVRDVVAAVVEVVEPLAERRGSDLRVRVPQQPCMAELDRRRVERVLRNLVANAIEHGEGRPVDVRVGADADAVAVTVTDHGVGLTPEEALRVFDRFWRADPARARSTGGSGLGLAISLEDALLHGGWLQAWGEPGRGACFRLTLPRRAGGVLSSSPLPLVPEGAA